MKVFPIEALLDWLHEVHAKGGQPTFVPMPKVVRELRLGAGHGLRRELTKSDFLLKQEVVELFRTIRGIASGILLIECRHGLPAPALYEVEGVSISLFHDRTSFVGMADSHIEVPSCHPQEIKAHYTIEAMGMYAADCVRCRVRQILRARIIRADETSNVAASTMLCANRQRQEVRQ